jgi:hypothetical protein
MFNILDAGILLLEKRAIVVTFPGPERGTALCALGEQEPVFSAADFTFAEFKRIVLAVWAGGNRHDFPPRLVRILRYREILHAVSFSIAYEQS